jgi:hypothetical protein
MDGMGEDNEDDSGGGSVALASGLKERGNGRPGRHSLRKPFPSPIQAAGASNRGAALVIFVILFFSCPSPSCPFPTWTGRDAYGAR